MWFGLSIMLAMVVGLVWWCVWAYRSDKVRQDRPSAEEQARKEA
jgi:heme/copper-type cytochrome/quinol oxidase subunit 2